MISFLYCLVLYNLDEASSSPAEALNLNESLLFPISCSSVRRQLVTVLELLLCSVECVAAFLQPEVSFGCCSK